MDWQGHPGHPGAVQTGTMSDTVPSELATVLRAWRDRLTPEAAGMPRGAVRRAPGLRREELASLAGLSVDYLVRLEQGRATNPSPQVLAALARALRLTTDERDHLYRAAGAAIPAAGTVPRHVTPGVQRIIDRLDDTPVGVFSAAWDVITWNPMWAALQGDPSVYTATTGNLVWRGFLGDTSHILLGDPERRAFERDIVADLRSAAGRYPTDPSLAALVADLLAHSPRFESIWAEAPVSLHLSAKKTMDTPLVGRITLDCDVLTAPGSDLHVVVYTAEPGTPDADRLELLRVAGLQSFSLGS